MVALRGPVWIHSLLPKLIVAFLLVIAPLYGLGLAINKMGESSVKKELSKSLQSRVDYYLNALEIEKGHIQNLERDYVLDKDVMRLSLLSEAMPQYEWSDTVTRTHNKLQLVKSSSIYIKNVSVHILTLGRTITDSEYISDRINDDYEAVKPGAASEAKELTYWNGRLFIGTAYPVTQEPSRIQPSYVVSIELDTDELRRALLRFTDYAQSGALLVDPQRGWSIENAKDAGMLPQLTPFLRDKLKKRLWNGIEPLATGGQRYLVAYRYSPDLGAFLSVYVPQSQVFGQINTYRGLYWILSALSAVIIIVYSYWIFRLIHRPLRTLVRSFRKVEDGQLETAALPRSSDEFLYLFQRFNMMIERLKVLIQQAYEEKIRSQSSELKQLQSQINPHFLYNTYFILFRLAKVKDHDNVARFSQYLGEYFRYITRSADNVVPLESEVKHSRTYMEIQHMRFHDRIQVDFGELPEGCKQVIVPKLILQPIMENAYKHGLESRRKDGKIVVAFRRAGDTVLISVEDNGETLTDERLAELESELANDRIDQEYTGLLNVHRRLRIMFGNDCGIAVARGDSGGLKVTLKLLAGGPREPFWSSRASQGGRTKPVYRDSERGGQPMYRLLIVDDEPFIVDGLVALFEETDAMQLEVFQASDGEEALELAGRLRMDIVLTDIQMPGMNGIELQQAIARQWPRCKVIFLSGYDDFQYVQSSIRGGALDYVLKAEGDEPIVAAVEKAIAQITAELTYERLLAGARDELKAALPMFRKEYMLELLHGEPSTAESRRQRFAELGIPLRGGREVLLALGRVDRWREQMVPGDKALFAFSVNNILEEYFANAFHSVYLAYEHDRFCWLLQSKADGAGAGDADWSRLAAYALGTLEAVQASCRDCLKLRCSFVVGSEPSAWEQLPGKFDRLNGLFLRGLGTGSEVLLSDRHLLRASQLTERDSLKKIGVLGQYLEQKEADKFAALYAEIMGAVRGDSAMQTGLALETFYQMSAMFISYLNRWELLADISEAIRINRLFSLEEHASWEEATRFFRELADQLFARRADENERELDEVVRRIHEYAGAHLDGDLSLNQLSEIVHLTPYYLSRLYKQKTGENVTDYIASARIALANELLGGTALKIQDIGVRVGYESASYFTRFYKKITGLTPQEYRDSLKR